MSLSRRLSVLFYGKEGGDALSPLQSGSLRSERHGACMLFNEHNFSVTDATVISFAKCHLKKIKVKAKKQVMETIPA